MTDRRLGRLLSAREGELLPALLAVALYFCVMFAYFILKPLRDAMGLDGGVDSLRVLFLVGLAVMVLANGAFGLLSSRFPRRVFIPAVYVFAIASLGVFLVLFLGGEASPMVGKVFYIWLSVFNLFAVSVMWGLLADIFDLEQSKRLFGLIAVGGTAGAILGAAYAGLLVERLGEVGLFASAAAVLVGIVALVLTLDRVAIARGLIGQRDPASPESAPLGGASLGGIRDAVANPYLRTISVYVLIYTVMSTLLFFEKNRIVDAIAESREERAQLFAIIETVSQTATILVQVFLTGRLMRTIGVGKLLAAVPAVSVVGFAAITIFPGLVVIAAFEAVRKCTNYTLSRPARETLYTVLPRDEKYKAKSFIDTFVYRGGDSMGALADLAIAAVALPAAFLAIPLGFAAMAVSALLGRAERDKAEQDAPPPPAPAAAPPLAIPSVEKG